MKAMKPQRLTRYLLLSIILVSESFLSVAPLGLNVRGGTAPQANREVANANWPELIASMEKMHIAMGAVKRTGDSDVDFVTLMLPHHQAAIDMAKTELLHGKDPQIRRLAQEIITDQKSEIDLMQSWLKQKQIH
jgi:uncharacterized protein (DUF305 family)